MSEYDICQECGRLLPRFGRGPAHICEAIDAAIHCADLYSKMGEGVRLLNEVISNAPTDWQHRTKALSQLQTLRLTLDDHVHGHMLAALARLEKRGER